VPTRTTLTLDDDVAAGLKQAVRKSGRPFRSVVNDALRAGLASPERSTEPFRVRARAMGLRPGVDLDDIEGLLDILEGPERR